MGSPCANTWKAEYGAVAGAEVCDLVADRDDYTDAFVSCYSRGSGGAEGGCERGFRWVDAFELIDVGWVDWGGEEFEVQGGARGRGDGVFVEAGNSASVVCTVGEQGEGGSHTGGRLLVAHVQKIQGL